LRQGGDGAALRQRPNIHKLRQLQERGVE
jgi:hypothetical protein